MLRIFKLHFYYYWHDAGDHFLTAGSSLRSAFLYTLFDFCLFFKYCEVCGIVKPPHRPNSTLPCGVCLIEKFGIFSAGPLYGFPFRGSSEPEPRVELCAKCAQLGPWSFLLALVLRFIPMSSLLLLADISRHRFLAPSFVLAP